MSAFSNDSHYITEAQLNALLAAMNNTIDSLRNRIEELENGGTPVNPDPVNPDTTITPVNLDPVNPDTTITPDTPVYIDGLACPGIATVTDIDGNVYNTVQIGNQCWMKENMRAKHYADGSSISYYAYSSSDIPLEQRGYFYTWSAVMNGASSSDTTPSGVQGICPTSWHVPSKGEWTELSQYVGSQSQYLCGNNSNYIAKALASTQRWYSCTNTCAVGNVPSINNNTGFSAVPVGYHGSSYNDYNESGYCAYFWSSTEYSFSGAYARRIGYNDAGVSIFLGSKNYGYPVRCLRD